MSLNISEDEGSGMLCSSELPLVGRNLDTKSGCKGDYYIASSLLNSQLPAVQSL